MLRNRSGAEEIIAPGGKDIQEDAFFQADGSVLQAGGNHDGIPGIQDDGYSPSTL